jgi:hypothetical protein
VTRLTRLIENAAQSIADLEQRKKSVIESQYKDPRTLQMPTYDAPPATHRRHHMVMNGSSIRDNVGIFNPKSSTADIYRTWKNLRKYGMQNYFTEEDYIEAFTKVVEGEAVGQLDNMITSNFNLEKILKFWAGIYGGKRNLQTERAQIQNFQRKKNEHLRAAMLRAAVIIEQFAPQYDITAWPAIRTVHLRDVLNRIITPQVARHINAIEENHQMDGYRATLDEIQQAAHFYEQAHDKMPPSEWPPEIMTNEISAQLNHAASGMTLNSLSLPINSAAWNAQAPQPMEIETNRRFQSTSAPTTSQPPPYPTSAAAPRSRYDRNKSPSNTRYRSGSRGDTVYSKPYGRPQSQSPGRYNTSQQPPLYNKPPEIQQRGRTPSRERPPYQRTYSSDKPVYQQNRTPSSDARRYDDEQRQRDERRRREEKQRADKLYEEEGRRRADYQKKEEDRKRDEERRREMQRRADSVERRQRAEAHRGPSTTKMQEDLPLEVPKQDINIITGHNNAYYKCNATKCWKNNYHLIDEDYRNTIITNPGTIEFPCPDKKN